MYTDQCSCMDCLGFIKKNCIKNGCKKENKKGKMEVNEAFVAEY